MTLPRDHLPSPMPSQAPHQPLWHPLQLEVNTQGQLGSDFGDARGNRKLWCAELTAMLFGLTTTRLVQRCCHEGTFHSSSMSVLPAGNSEPQPLRPVNPGTIDGNGVAGARTTDESGWSSRLRFTSCRCLLTELFTVSHKLQACLHLLEVPRTRALPKRVTQ